MNFSGNKLRKAVEVAKADGRDGKTIAAEGGFSPPSLSAWMNQGVVPSADQLAALSRVLRVPLDYFFEGQGEVITEALRESPVEYLIDDLIAEAQEIRERAAQLEMKARKLKPTKASSKPPRLALTPENVAKVTRQIEGDQKSIKEGIAKLTKRVIADVDNPEVKPEGNKK